MITNDGMTGFALTEYSRDGEFRTFVDRTVEALIKRGVVRPGTPLQDVLSLELPDGQHVAKDLLQRFHDRSTLPQWQRKRLSA